MPEESIHDIILESKVSTNIVATHLVDQTNHDFAKVSKRIDSNFVRKNALQKDHKRG